MKFSILLSFVYIYFWSEGTLSAVYSKLCKGENQILFMNECWCKPGYEENSLHDSCHSPILKIADCECEPLNVDRNFLQNATWGVNNDWSPPGIRCTNLCRSNSKTGVPISIPGEWLDNNNWKQLGFYKKELTKASLTHGHNHLRERLDEFANGFEQFTYLNNTDLGDVIEFGCGGYTQMRNIMERVNVKVRSITLLDPKLDEYRTIRGCTYESGVFSFGDVSVPSTTLSNLTVEEWGKLHSLYSPSLYDPFTSSSAVDPAFASQSSHHNEQHHKKHPTHTTTISSGLIGSANSIRTSASTLSVATTDRRQFDTVIVMNVLVYAKNAFQYLETVYNSVRPGGLLIFHDRWFDDPAVSSRCKMAGFLVNILQVRKPLLDHFLSETFFDQTPFFSTNQTANQLRRSREWCRIDWDNERAFWVALRKKI